MRLRIARSIPQTSQGSQQGGSILALWHLLSLDAPTVAALWMKFIARVCGVALSWRPVAAMFVAVWMLYAADRLLDARALGYSASAAPAAEADLEARHHFHHRHRVGFVSCIALAGALLAILVPALPVEALRLYVVLACLLVAYFLLIHLGDEHLRRLLPKELAVGLFFSAAVFIPAMAHLPLLRLPLLPASVLFAALCTLNCLYVYSWEHPGARLAAHWTTLWGVRHLSFLDAAIAVCALTLALVQIARPGVAQVPFHGPVHLYLLSLACALVAILLGFLHRLRSRFSATPLRAAADFVLLAPVLLLPWW